MNDPLSKADSLVTRDDPQDTRERVRLVANRMLDDNEMPNAERVRKRFYDLYKARPSTLTVNDEMKAWMDDTFWPRFRVFSKLKGHSSVSRRMQKIYEQGFNQIVIGAVESANGMWESERQAMREQIVEREARLTDAHHREADLQDAVSQAQAQSTVTQHIVNALQNQLTYRTQQIDELHAALATAHEEILQAAQRSLDYERKIAQTREEERSRADREIAAARDSVRKVQLELDGERQAVKRHEATHERQQAEIREVTGRLTQSEAARAAAEAEVLALKDAHRKQLAQLNATIERLSAPVAETPRRGTTPAAPARDHPLRQQLRKNTVGK
jgi:chromosome segregation ATPase